MLQKILWPALLAAAALPLFSCEKRTDAPSDACYTGRIVALTCENGVLIDVDPRFPIGQPTARNSAGGPVALGKNVISVSNSRGISGISGISLSTNPGTQSPIGLRLYFSAQPDSVNHGLGCYVADGVRSPVPALRLSNVSTTACQPAGQ